MTLGLLGGCSGGEAATTYDPCSPLTIGAAAETAASELESVEQAVLSWSHVLPVRIEVSSSTEVWPDLTIRFESGESCFRGVYCDERAEISVSLDQLDPAIYPLVVAHELGHAF